MSARASTTVSASCERGKGRNSKYPVARSTRVMAALLEFFPMIRSPSQWPGTRRPSTSSGRSVILAPSTHDLPNERATASLERGLRLVRPERFLHLEFVTQARTPVYLTDRPLDQQTENEIPHLTRTAKHHSNHPTHSRRCAHHLKPPCSRWLVNRVMGGLLSQA